MMPKQKLQHLCLSLGLVLSLGAYCLLANPLEVNAQSILINDCQGFTRAARSVDEGSTNKVDIKFNAASNTEVTLTNTVTGEVSTTYASSGVASFGNVTPGVYTIAAASSEASLAAISISTTTVGLAAASSAVLVAGTVGAGAAVGVGVGVVEVVDEVDSSPKSEPTPAPTNAPTPLPTSTPPATLPSPTPTPRPEPEVPVEPPPSNDCNCDPDERPAPLDEDQFFRTTRTAQYRDLSPSS